MSEFRYRQFCPVSRAAELIGERWTLLILRELFSGPQRFSDLRRRLRGVSSSVLAQRLERLERHGLIQQAALPPPAAARVYALDEAGRALRPAFLELARWGVRFLGPPRRGDQIEPAWVRIGLEAFAKRGASPRCAIEIRMRAGEGELAFRVRGGRRGTAIDAAGGASDAVLRTEPLTLLAMACGALAPGSARREGAIEIEGDASVIELLPELFEIELGTVPSDPAARATL